VVETEKDREMTLAFASIPNRTDGYAPVAHAIDYLVANFDRAPSLEDTAAEIGMSPAHFQRVFKAGAGVSPKRFLQFLAAGEAKRAMGRGESVLEASYSAGLSGPSRLHDLFLVAEAMTPGAYRQKGAGETIRYASVDGPFGRALIGATGKGVCWLSFEGAGGRAVQIAEMKGDWPAATFVEDAAFIAPLAEKSFAFARGLRLDRPLGLHVQGTNFQLKVWEALLKIPFGGKATYGEIAREVNAPKASRAVGAAVGANMISLLIPCHRVILSSGVIHNYRWGVARKKAILAMEDAMSAA
jgi:AraC family transcriptional regulator of adaptative response/methylated-DNA-[protein]-cysteine methyltransferase